MDYSTENLKDILLENDYPASNKKMLESVIRQLQNLTEEGKCAVENWYNARNLPNFNIEGITPQFLQLYHHATDIAIILAYDGLIRNPKSAYLLKKPVIKYV